MENLQQKYEKKLTQAHTLINKIEQLNNSLKIAEHMQIGYVAASEIEPSQKNYDKVNKQEQVIERLKENLNDKHIKLSDLKREISELENEMAQLSFNQLEMTKDKK